MWLHMCRREEGERQLLAGPGTLDLVHPMCFGSDDHLAQILTAEPAELQDEVLLMLEDMSEHVLIPIWRLNIFLQ